MQVVFEEEWSKANWKQGHTYRTHKGAFEVINVFCETLHPAVFQKKKEKERKKEEVVWFL